MGNLSKFATFKPKLANVMTLSRKYKEIITLNPPAFLQFNEKCEKSYISYSFRWISNKIREIIN